MLGVPEIEAQFTNRHNSDLLRGLGSNSVRGICVVILGKTCYLYKGSLHPGVHIITGEFNAGVGGRLSCDGLVSHPVGSRKK